MNKRTLLIWILALGAARLPQAEASCPAAPCYRTEARIRSCKEVDPTKRFPPRNLKVRGHSFYQGVILELDVLSLQRIPCTANDKVDQDSLEKPRLPHRTTAFRSSKKAHPCAHFKKGESTSGVLTSACCVGDPNPPCLLGFSE